MKNCKFIISAGCRVPGAGMLGAGVPGAGLELPGAGHWEHPPCLYATAKTLEKQPHNKPQALDLWCLAKSRF